MLLIECSPPFQPKPKVFRTYGKDGSLVLWRFIWLWFGVARVPFEFNSFIKNIAKAGAKLAAEGDSLEEESES